MSKQEKNKTPRSMKKELPDDLEGAAPFESILSLARSSTTVAPPSDFTLKLMQRLAVRDIKSVQVSDSRLLSRRFLASIGRLTKPDSVLEVATCFFLTGFFYLVLGLSLHVGLKSLNAAPTATGWVYYQPHIAVLIAAGFITLGVLFLKNSRLAFQIANSTTLFFILFSIFNGVQVQSSPANPFSLGGVICLSVGTILLGIFLALTVNNCRRWSSPTKGDNIVTQ